jgi:RecA-family ATPase
MCGGLRWTWWGLRDVGDDDMDGMSGPVPIPDDPGYLASLEADTNLIPDGDDVFIDTRPEQFAPVQPAKPVELLPQVMTESLINLPAETALLAALMQDNGLVATLSLAQDDFAEPLHQRLYAAITDTIATGKAATPITLWPRFAKDSALAELGGVSYLATLTASIGAVMGAKANAAHLKDLATRRRLAGVAQEVAKTIADPQGDMASALAYLDDARKAQAADNAPMQATCMAALHDVEIPPRQWVVKGWLPSNAVTYFGGPGGVGKSLAVQQWMSAISLGINFMAAETMAQVPCLYVTCEDEADEVARRNADIAQALGFTIRALTDMHCISLAGAEGNELGTFDAERRYRPSERFHRIVATAKAVGARVVALDNVAHLFTGNENIRGEVTQFVNLLNRLAQEIDGSVILLGHPAKVEGSEYSGSTAWENAVRSRLFLCRPEGDAEAGEVDPNARELVRSKSNYAAKDEALHMVWHHGAFIPPSHVPEAARPQFEAAALHNERFLACLDKSISQGRAVSHNPRAGNFAPRQFVKMPGGKGMKQAEYEAAMERLLGLGEIKTDAVMPFKTASRHPIFGLGRA